MSNLTIAWGSDDTFDTTIAHATLPAGGLAGASATFYAKKSKTDADSAALITKTATITTVGSSSVDGVISTAVVAADTNTLPRYTQALFWRLVVTDAGGAKSVPDEGMLIVDVG